MTRSRPLERDDLPEVALLYTSVMRTGSEDRAADVAAYLERTVLDHPWADPELPSLVHLDDGRIVGFIGSYVRRLRFDGEPIRLACSGQLVAARNVRSQGVGALLTDRYMNGPQDLTITDGATETARRIWEARGGETAHLRCIGWTRVLRPWGFAGEQGLRRRELGVLKPVLGTVLPALDAVTSRLPGAFFQPPRPSATGEPLTPSVLLEHLPALAGRLRLFPDYDLVFLEWLFRELAQVTSQGVPVAQLVRGDGGRPLGWYVYYLKPGGVCKVLQVVARDRDVGTVLDHLFLHAWLGGGAAVHGRVEATLLEPLSSRRCFLRYQGGSLVHSRRPEILDAVRGGRSLLTRMEGEWWMGHHLIDLVEGPPPLVPGVARAMTAPSGLQEVVEPVAEPRGHG